MDTAYVIKRSPKRRKLTITVERDRSVVVHGSRVHPRRDDFGKLSSQNATGFMQRRSILRSIQSVPILPGKELVNGESTLYLGREYQIEIIPTDSTEIRFERRFLIPASLAGERRSVLRNWYIDRAKAWLLPKVKSSAATLGVEFTSAKIVDNRFRWGLVYCQGQRDPELATDKSAHVCESITLSCTNSPTCSKQIIPPASGISSGRMPQGWKRREAG